MYCSVYNPIKNNQYFNRELIDSGLDIEPKKKTTQGTGINVPYLG